MKTTSYSPCFTNHRQPNNHHPRKELDGRSVKRGRRMFTVLVGTGILGVLASGCGSIPLEGRKAGRTASSSSATASVPVPEFTAPYDVGMGQIVVAVAPVSVSAPVPTDAGDLGKMVRSQLANCLASSPNFLVADRESLPDIALEHELAQVGGTRPDHQPVSGALISPRFLIKVDVTDFKEDTVATSRGSRFETGAVFSILGAFIPGAAGTAMEVLSATNPTFGRAKGTVRGVVGFELRVVEVDTGSVVRATRALGSITRENSQSLFGMAGFSTTGTSFQQTVVADALRTAVQDAVLQVHGILRYHPQMAAR